MGSLPVQILHCLLNILSLLENISMELVDLDTRLFIYRIVSLDMNASISSEVEILCNQADCDLSQPVQMEVLKNSMYVVDSGRKKISVFEGISKFPLYKISICGPKWLLLISSKLMTYNSTTLQ